MRALQLGVLALVGAALPVSLYVRFVRPQRAEAIEAAEQRLAAGRKEIQDLEAVAGHLPEFQREQETLRERLALLDRIRPARKDPGPLLEQLRALGSSEGLDGVWVEEVSPGEDGPSFRLRMGVRGAPPALVALLGRASQIARLLRVDRIELERQDRGRYEMTLRIVAFRDTGSPRESSER
jgi:Tfp pilus assembly protein PilO